MPVMGRPHARYRYAVVWYRCAFVLALIIFFLARVQSDPLPSKKTSCTSKKCDKTTSTEQPVTPNQEDDESQPSETGCVSPKCTPTPQASITITTSKYNTSTIKTKLNAIPSSKEKSHLTTITTESEQDEESTTTKKPLKIYPSPIKNLPRLTTLETPVEEKGEDIETTTIIKKVQSGRSGTLKMVLQSKDSISTCMPKCLSHSVCAKYKKKNTSNSTSSVSTDRLIKMPGYEIVQGCNTTFYIGKKQMAISESNVQCCSAGLRNVNIETLDKMACIGQLLKGVNRTSYVVPSTLWVGSTDFQCAGNFLWCEALTWVDPGMFEARGTADKDTGCVTLSFRKGKSAVLVTAPCLFAKAATICEPHPVYDTTTVSRTVTAIKSKLKATLAATTTREPTTLAPTRTSTVTKWVKEEPEPDGGEDDELQ